VRVCGSARKSDDWERVMTERVTERVHVRVLFLSVCESVSSGENVVTSVRESA
jgi:hypothetical protein